MTTGRDLRVVGFALSIGAVAATLTARLAHTTGTAFPGRWVTITALFAITEITLIHFEHRSEAHSVSLSAVPLVVGMFFLDPLALIGARLVGVLLASGVVRRQAPIKMVVNLASFWLGDVIAIMVFRNLGADGFGPAMWPAAFAAALVADQVQGFAVTGAISLYQGRFEYLTELAWLGPAISIVNTALALVAVTLLRAEPAALVLLGSVVPFLLVSYRAHAGLREKHRELDQLYRFTRTISGAFAKGRVAETLLEQVQELMHAESAWLCLADEEGRVLRVRVTADGTLDSMPMPPKGIDARLHGLAHAAGTPLLVNAGESEGMSAIGVTQALVAPLRHVGPSPATVVVTNRSGDVRGFGDGDLHLFATLVGHASSTLENDHLVDQLRQQAAQSEHQSLHDALTGLPNRTFFAERVNTALASGAPVAVLLLDLDRFKEINDTLGHHTGDVLLQSVAARLRDNVRAGDVVARLGGDEFAVLATDVRDAEGAQRIARHLVEALDMPVELDSLWTTVHASVGIALAPTHGQDPASLLRCADVAMYTAKSDRTGVEVYEQSRDDTSTDRLVLAGLLRDALDNHRINVHFQPQVDLATGEVLGAEALVRWGGDPSVKVSPAELVALAEHAGMIKPLTEQVLAQALAECRRWWDAGRELRVSVNLSAQNMLDTELEADVLRALDTAGLPPQALCLEVTETGMMADPARTAVVLTRLHDAGISIAIDDFGTGYSSLAYLKQLPVDEVKIDRGFIMDMDQAESDEIIVRSIIGLGRNLHLRVVAEGIETKAVQDRLERLGCDIGQGYHFSRPIPAAEFAAWLTGSRIAATGLPVDAGRVELPADDVADFLMKLAEPLSPKVVLADAL